MRPRTQATTAPASLCPLPTTTRSAATMPLRTQATTAPASLCPLPTTTLSSATMPGRTSSATICPLPAATRSAATMPPRTPMASIFPLPAITITSAVTMHRTTTGASIWTLPAAIRYTTTFSTILTTFISPPQILTHGTPQKQQARTSSAAPPSAATSGHIRMALALVIPAQILIAIIYAI